MLPFLQKNKEASVSAMPQTIQRDHDENSEQEFDALETAAEDLINAIHAKDVKGVTQALRAAFDLQESEPHDEGPHEGEE